jgi:PST family polysaccharide transporter
VSTPNDYYTALIIELSFGTIAGILVSSAIYKEISSIKKSDLKNVFIQLKNAYPFFVMNITINLYTSMNTLILGIFATANIVGTYAIAEKIIVACKRILQPISTVLFHRLINSLKENTYFIKVMLMTLIYFAFGIVMAAILLFYGDSIIYLIYGKPLHKTEQLLAIMCAVPLLTYLSNIFAINVLIIHHKERLLMNITIFSGFFGILICYFLTMFFQEIGTAISLVSTELCVLIMSLFFSKAILFNKGLKQC